MCTSHLYDVYIFNKLWLIVCLCSVCHSSTKGSSTTRDTLHLHSTWTTVKTTYCVGKHLFIQSFYKLGLTFCRRKCQYLSLCTFLQSTDCMAAQVGIVCMLSSLPCVLTWVAMLWIHSYYIISDLLCSINESSMQYTAICRRQVAAHAIVCISDTGKTYEI